MPPAIVLTTQSKANLTGGTFADTLAANSGDSTAIANYGAGGARILEAWTMDSASVAEIRMRATRPESTHDLQQGVRFMLHSTTPGGAGKQGALLLFPGYPTVPVFKSDTITIDVSGTAADNVAVSYLTQYDDLPGVKGQFASWPQIQALHKSTVGIRCDAVASGTAGAYGATRAINADDDRLHADTYYAILGCTVQTPVVTVAMQGPAWGGQRFGMPGDSLQQDTSTWFVKQSVFFNTPMIPWFSSNDKANVLLSVVDTTASTSPKIDLLMYELLSAPG